MIHLVQAEPVINGAVGREGGMVGRVAWFAGNVVQLGLSAAWGSLVRRQRGPAWFAGSVGQLSSLAAWASLVRQQRGEV